jgi:hypothetical protein
MLLKWILVLYKTIILPIVLYRCKIWSLILKEEHSLRAFENRGLEGKILTGEGLRGAWRKLRNENLHNLYSSPNTISITTPWRMRRTGHIARMVGNLKERDH